MATAKKKEVKVRDLKPSKDAKGGRARTQQDGTTRISANSARTTTNSGGRNLL